MSRRASLALALAALAALAAAPLPIAAQTVSGTAFHDRDADGVREPGEEPLSGVAVRLYGQRDAGGAFDEGATTGATGEFSFAPGNGCYLLDLEDPPGWRRTLARTDEFAPGSPGYTHPV
ncbi:MAG: hypothetical protein KBD01_20280, partial [Acidobacteria bacterium]|nr:hypothetical protein [Acidobacteriota bacterium]